MQFQSKYDLEQEVCLKSDPETKMRIKVVSFSKSHITYFLANGQDQAVGFEDEVIPAKE
jgi:hypothetical protein